ncbi:ubiquitin carboxyl-terminal hydrolase 51-like [Ursus americanus]|uniref:ubiquitin carboxyl-terminal hydrolase 51-like n=1 Tax=Ursus americanus TaxID=9643 RepID=UPI001E67B93D|nr:ubiquitin carboxyl-terminal hydrolase 51-like [Ursus americanus]
MLTCSGDGLNEESAIPGGGGLGLKQPGPTLETLSSRGSGAGTQPLAECLTVRETEARGRRTRPRPRKHVPEEATLEHSIYGSVQGAPPWPLSVPPTFPAPGLDHRPPPPPSAPRPPHAAVFLSTSFAARRDLPRDPRPPSAHTRSIFDCLALLSLPSFLPGI